MTNDQRPTTNDLLILNKMIRQVNFSAIIPAAGLSGRMGKPKALLPYDENESFAFHLLKAYDTIGVKPLIFVLNDQTDIHLPEKKNIIIIKNKNPEYGRSHSIKLALEQIPEGYATFIHNIDNPYAEKDLLKKMIDLLNDENYVVPVFKGKGGHPVLLGMNIINFLKNMGEFSNLKDILVKFNRRELIYDDEEILRNINTPEDYRKFQEGQ